MKQIRPKLKICGITRLEDALFCIESGVDYMGVILDPDARRHADRNLIDGIDAVGGNVCAVYTSMSQFMHQRHNEKLAQLHFPFTEKDLNEFQDEGIPVMGVAATSFEIPIHIRLNFLSQIDLDYILLDFRDGILNHLSQLKKMRLPENLALAGHVTSDEVRELAILKPKIIDVSSSVETSPGIKDHSKIRELIEKMEGMNNVFA